MASPVLVGTHSTIYHEGRNIGQCGAMWVLALVTNGRKDINVYSSTDLVTWSLEGSTTLANALTAFSLTADDSLVHIAYARDSESDLYYRSFNLSTSTFGSEEHLRAASNIRSVNIIETGGDLWVTWEQSSAQGVFAIQKTGGAWQSVETIEDGTWWNEDSGLAVDGSGQLHLAIDWFVYTRSTGGSWSREDNVAGTLYQDAVSDPNGDAFWVRHWNTDQVDIARLTSPYTTWSSTPVYTDEDDMFNGSGCAGNSDTLIVGFSLDNYGGNTGKSFMVRQRVSDVWQDIELVKAGPSQADELQYVRSFPVRGTLNGVLFILLWGGYFLVDEIYTYFVECEADDAPQETPEPKPLWRTKRIADPGRHPRYTGRRVKEVGRHGY